MHIYLFTVLVMHGSLALNPQGQKPRLHFLSWSLAGVGVYLAIVGVLWVAELVFKPASQVLALL